MRTGTSFLKIVPLQTTTGSASVCILERSSTQAWQLAYGASEVCPMLSKCLNSHCSATFRYLGQGRLFRMDFAEVGKKRALAGKEFVSSIRSKSHPVEYFWLCESCAAAMTIELSDAGEVRLVALDVSTQSLSAVPTPETKTQRIREASAS